MNKSESKYFNTAIRMDEALISLLERKDFEFITVKEICENAEVNRSTFYLHYETIADLLSETLEYMNQKFLACFQADAATIIDKIKSAKKDELIFITPEYLNPYLNFIKDNKRIFLTAMNKLEIYETDIRYDKLYKHFFEPIMERFLYPKEKRRYMSAFYVQGIMGIINEWIKGGCIEEVSEIGKIITEIILQDKKNRSQ